VILTWDEADLMQIEEGKTAFESGRITKIYYDEMSRRSKITRYSGAEEITLLEYTYDLEDNILVVKNALGQANTKTYDVLGRLINEENPLSQNTEYEYDRAGNLVLVTDANSNTTEYEYHAQNRLAKAIRYDGAALFETTYTYDAAGNIKTVTDAKGQATTNTYDGAGRLVAVEDPLGYTTQYEYDNNSNLTLKVDANGHTTEYEYDEYSRLAGVYYNGKADPVKTEVFDYDEAGNLESYSDGTYSAIYSYDELNRIISNEQVYPFAGSKTITYTYDPFGNTASAKYPDAADKISYSYDELNRMTAIAQGTAAVAYEYDASGRLTKKTLPNGVYSEYTYDDAGSLLALDNRRADASVVSQFSYTHNATGNRLTMTTTAGTHNYEYDGIYRLTAANHPVSINEDEEYTYDTAGNRESSAEHSDWTYDAGNRLQGYGGEATFNYDNNGNTTQKDNNGSLTTYDWDYENRLIEAITPNHTAQYSYGPFGKRLSKTVDGAVTYYLYDNDDLVAEYDEAGNLIASYLHGQWIDEPVMMARGADKYYYTFDGLGSVSEITDDAGAIVESYEYNAFGNILNPQATSNPFTYTAREYDAETGLYFYRERYYDPQAGRFLTPDPIGFSAGPNFYTYVNNNPLNWIDPWGLEVCATGDTQKSYSDYFWDGMYDDSSSYYRTVNDFINPDFSDSSSLEANFWKEIFLNPPGIGGSVTVTGMKTSVTTGGVNLGVSSTYAGLSFDIYSRTPKKGWSWGLGGQHLGISFSQNWDVSLHIGISEDLFSGRWGHADYNYLYENY
ncbi:MAG: RHS repeat protein, partial [Gammaproteobacteria bacterium]|nr:RHS repeat protein [Gammaproteobacteria bacterium]